MLIYTGQTTGEKLGKIQERKMGIMISSNPNTLPSKEFNSVPCALDNGAFSCWLKGYPFMPKVFFDTLERAYKNSIKLDFVVCPDIVAGGRKSLDLSMRYADNELLGTRNLALVLQDGMEEKDIDLYILSKFQYLFIGGTIEWKWKTAKSWVDFGHLKNKKVHIGRVGRIEWLRKAKEIGADSVDSASFTINDSFHIIDDFYGKSKQFELEL